MTKKKLKKRVALLKRVRNTLHEYIADQAQKIQELEAELAAYKEAHK